jgi:eukaryotic-like serine/threonine-protein kinase
VKSPTRKAILQAEIPGRPNQPGSSAPVMSKLVEGTTVAGRFVIVEPLGEGGMGAVYRALQTSLDREVALKVLHSEQAFTARARRRFGREARAVARLNHPHIASVFDFGTDNDDQTLWLAMELVDGQSLSVLKRDPINVLRLVSLTDQMLSALSAAHARGIIHRDLKPSNILLTRDNEGREIIKLVDFGLAATQGGELDLENAPGGLGDEESEATQKPVIMGTPRYMAPELFRRLPIEPRVDLYALGIILYEILAGQPPYPGDDPRAIMKGHLREPIPQLKVREGDIPALLERCIYTLLAKDPAHRYESAAEVRDVMQHIIGEYSYVPWMVTGPSLADPGNMSHPGNLSAMGFLSNWGGQTIPPAARARAASCSSRARPGLGKAAWSSGCECESKKQG